MMESQAGNFKRNNSDNGENYCRFLAAFPLLQQPVRFRWTLEGHQTVLSGVESLSSRMSF